MSLIGFKIHFTEERIRIIPFESQFPSFIVFKQTIFEAFPRLTAEIQPMVYFTWTHLNDEIIIRKENELQFDLQHFWRGNEMPTFQLWFEQQGPRVLDGSVSSDPEPSRKKNRTTLAIAIPQFDF